MNLNDRYKLYLKAGGEFGNNWRYMQFISICWNMYGKEIQASKSIDGKYHFTEVQKNNFNLWLDREIDNGLTEQFTCNLALQTGQ